jgi:hypothetical protein
MKAGPCAVFVRLKLKKLKLKGRQVAESLGMNYDSYRITAHIDVIFLVVNFQEMFSMNSAGLSKRTMMNLLRMEFCSN